MPSPVRIDRAALATLLNSPEMAAELVRRAESVKSRAEAMAPRDTGELAASHRVVTDYTGGRAGRVRVRVVAEAPYAAIVAAKTGYLGRALAEGGTT